MAKARRTVTDQVVTETKRVPAVTLTLTIEEAETLIAVGSLVAGDAETSPRRHYEAITEALLKAGVRDFTASGSHPFDYLKRSHPGVAFRSYPLTEAIPF
ncbi:hypothetical protein ABT160_04705 [Streptomyces sp. NPDC001941]|uniref:hypothetical protein n=1 Tax=Streptomyces sp. NPDC001941 TaxID=3154659 RepID=UPI0033301A9A